MNRSEVESYWAPMRRLVASYWKELGEDDLDRIGRSRDGLAALHRDRYGWDAGRVGEEIHSFEKDVRWPGAMK
jgi:hypothetical protein